MNNTPKLYLSRYNLEALLRKLDDPNSLKTIVKYRNETDPYVNDIDTMLVIAVEDEELYTKRSRGKMYDEF